MAESSQIDNDETAHSLWKRWVIPLAVVLLFAAGILQFALIQWYHVPAKDRVNDGQEPTFFGLYLSPAFNFSEDFHLYYVRAKRIAQRGWSDSLFYSRPNEGKNYAAPVQVALCSLAVATDGRPVPYSLFMFGVLAVAWMSLYAAARAWLPNSVSTASILVAVLLTVLFESTHYIYSAPEFPTFGQWPMFRGLRMATMSWTSPLLVAVWLCVTSLVVDRRRWGARVVLLLGMLLLLAGADNWAFGLAWLTTGLVLAWIALTVGIGRVRSGSWPIATRQTVIGLALIIAAVFALHHRFNHSLRGDAMLRAGFGVEWRDSIRHEPSTKTIPEWFLYQGLLPLSVTLLGSWLTLRRNAAGTMRLQRQGSDALGVQIRFLALLPLAAMLAMYKLLNRQGMEPYLVNQLYWRLNYCWLFTFSLTALEGSRTALTAWAARRRKIDLMAALAGQTNQRRILHSAALLRVSQAWQSLRPKTWGAAIALGLVAFGVYHNYRIHWFVSNVAANDYFLSADAEKLRPWLEQFEQEHGKFELATASLELNYLAAYWTNADLLLPSGFPYHNSASNLEIRRRADKLLELYGATPQSWDRITRNTPGRFQEVWRTSRIKGSGEGFLYHFYHRIWTLHIPNARRWRFAERARIGKALKQNAASKSKTSVASYTSAAPPRAKPDVILIDPVSRALGTPDLSNYELAFHSGEIEAWIVSDMRRQGTPAALTAHDPAAR